MPPHQSWRFITAVWVVNWKFQRDDLTQHLPNDIPKCLCAHANDAIDLKYMNNSTGVGAIYSDLALVINHTPANPVADKLLTFTLCRRNDVLWNAHTLEPLPGNLLAVGTTGQRAWDGILVYKASAANALVANLPVLQSITGLRAIYSLIWDKQGQMLWAAGTDAAADSTDLVSAYGTIVGYPWDCRTGLLAKDHRYIDKLPNAYLIEAE